MLWPYSDNSTKNCIQLHKNVLQLSCIDVKECVSGVMEKLEEYICTLSSKGFKLGEEAIGFIYFGKEMTSAPDWIANIAIECTLKAQRRFDGGFYVSLLETLMNNKVSSRKEAYYLMKEYGIQVS